MNEYLLNCDDFNIIVRVNEKEYYILRDDPNSIEVLSCFLQMKEVPYQILKPLWFKYSDDETWQDFDNNKCALGKELLESELIDQFVLKKFNFGSLVALRDAKKQKVKIFKYDKLPDKLVAVIGR